MSEADRVFPCRNELGAQSSHSEQRLVLSTPRRSGAADGRSGVRSRVVEVVHVRRSGPRPVESRPRAAPRSVRAEVWPEGFRAKPALSPKVVELYQSAAVLADEFGFDQIRSGLVLLALVLNPSHTRVGEFTPELDRIDVDQLRDHFHEIVLGSTEAPAGGEGIT